MTRNVTLSADRRWLVAWGVDEHGLYLDVYANAPDECGEPVRSWDAQKDGLCPVTISEIAMTYGCEDIVRASLQGAY